MRLQLRDRHELQHELRHCRQAEAGHGGDSDAEQQPTLLAGVEVPQLDQNPTGHRLAGQIVQHRDPLDRVTGGPDHQAGRLDGLGQQPLEFAGDGGGRGVGLFCEAVVAGAADRQFRQDLVVVAQADADRRGRDGLRGSLDAHVAELGGVHNAGVGVTVGQQDDRRAAGTDHAPGLLQSAQVARGHVRAATGLDLGDRLPDPVATQLFDGGRRHGDLRLVVEHHETE